MGINFLRPRPGEGYRSEKSDAGRRRMAESDKNKGAEPGKIFSSNSLPGRHTSPSMFDRGRQSPLQRVGQGIHDRMQEARQNPGYGNTLQDMGHAGQRLANAALNRGLEAAGAALGGTVGRQFGKWIGKHKKETLYAVIAIQIALWLPALFVIFLLLDHGSVDKKPQQQGQTTQTSPLTVTVACNPPQIPIGGTSLCTISVSDTDNVTSVSVVVTIFPYAVYVKDQKISPQGTYDNTKKTVSWTNAPIGTSFQLRVSKTQNLEGVPIVATVTTAGGGAGGGTGAGNGYVAPNTDNCGGKYTSYMANNYLLHKNFGDPQCNFNKDQVYTDLEQQDPPDAATFFTIIIPCESGWIPDAWAPPSTGTPNSQGAWGLFQMGDSRPPGQSTDANTIDDRGDVNWQLQIVSATKRAKSTPSLNANNGGYWSGVDWTHHAQGNC